MGYLKERYGWMIAPPMIGGDVCQVCGTKHDSWLPHDQTSLLWQYRFFDKHGVWPSWMDAMAHCPKEVKKTTLSVLKERGIDPGELHIKEGENE